MAEELDDIVENLRERSAWIRVIFMVGFAIGLYLVIAPVAVVLTIVQALFALISGGPNDNLKRFGRVLTEYVGQILEFLFYNNHEKPFPFSDFPALDEKTGEKQDAGARKPAGAGGTRRSRNPPAGKGAAKKSAAKKAPSRKAPSKPTAGKGSTNPEGERQTPAPDNGNVTTDTPKPE